MATLQPSISASQTPCPISATSQRQIPPSEYLDNTGSGLFTWPPTNFTVDLTCNVRDSTGTLMATPRVVGTGSAETGERLRHHGIAGERAMEDALTKMQAALLETRFGGGPSNGQISRPQTSGGMTRDSAVRFAHLKELRDKGLINQAEYEAKRKAILD